MDEYADIYYVDSRNAVRDHRPGNRPWSLPRPLPPMQTVYVPPPRPPVYSPPIYNPPPVYPNPVYTQAPQVMYPGPVQSVAATLLGRLTTGQIIEMVAQVFAALQSLPAAPVSSEDMRTDVGNLVMYQTALAQHAKRDEQVRTLGSLVARLVG